MSWVLVWCGGATGRGACVPLRLFDSVFFCVPLFYFFVRFFVVAGCRFEQGAHFFLNVNVVTFW